MKVTVEETAMAGSILFGRTYSVCPICLKRIGADYKSRGNNVYLEKTCAEHGFFSVMVWKGVQSFLKWRGDREAEPDTYASCPYECGICASHRQETCCVLLEVTNRCNLRCPVCFASSGTDGKDPAISEIAGWYDMLMESGGPFNIQLSGGEPTLRPDLPEIIALGREKGFTFFQLNTNGIRIADEPDYLAKLVEAGLNTVFLQFDGLDRAYSLALRGADIVSRKLRSIENCAEAGVGVVLVPTVVKGVNDGGLGDILNFAAARMPAVRGVHFQPVSLFGRRGGLCPDSRVTIPELLGALEAQMDHKMRASDFAPSGAEHPLCGFHADYTIRKGQWTLQKSSGGLCCGKVTSGQARRVVARKWSRPAAPTTDKKLSMFDLSAMDDFLKDRRERTLAISGMAFQDAWNLDLNRLRRCYIHQVGHDGRLIPFCAYNLSAEDGTTLYRGKV